MHQESLDEAGQRKRGGLLGNPNECFQATETRAEMRRKGCGHVGSGCQRRETDSGIEAAPIPHRFSVQ